MSELLFASRDYSLDITRSTTDIVCAKSQIYHSSDLFYNPTGLLLLLVSCVTSIEIITEGYDKMLLLQLTTWFYKQQAECSRQNASSNALVACLL